jgi:hypothetical protein
MNSCLQGRKVPNAKDHYERPSVETLHLIRKLRWIGMEKEAERLQMKLQETALTGSVVTIARETD